VADLDACAPRVWVVLNAQGWTDIVVDHCEVVEEIVREFYTNLHQRHGDSFQTMVRRTKIEVTLTLINNITRAPQVRNPDY
jgi:hypothetical protein